MSKNKLKKYKANFILDTRTLKDSVESLIEKLSGVVETIGGKVLKVENRGQKDFTRAVDRKFPSGIYLEISFEGEGTVPAALQDKLRLDKTVDRIMIESL